MSSSFSYTSTIDAAQAAAMLRGARRIAVLTHWKPDGDANAASTCASIVA